MGHFDAFDSRNGSLFCGKLPDRCGHLRARQLPTRSDGREYVAVASGWQFSMFGTTARRHAPRFFRVAQQVNHMSRLGLSAQACWALLSAVLAHLRYTAR